MGTFFVGKTASYTNIVPESWVSHNESYTTNSASDTSWANSFSDAYDNDLDTYRQFYAHHDGDGSVEASLTHEHTWSNSYHIDHIRVKMYGEDYEGNYEGYRHEFRVYLKINGDWQQIDYGAWAVQAEGGRPYDPEGPTSNVSCGTYADHNHYCWYDNTISTGWDNVTGIKAYVWGGAYSYEGDRQQKVWLRIYEVQAFIAYVDCGLRIYDGTAVRTIACDPAGTLTSPLRIRKGDTTYGIVLVDTSDADASKIRTQTSSGIKALRLY